MGEPEEPVPGDGNSPDTGSSALCAAILRISESLDTEHVLQEAVHAARSLADARYALIATVDEFGAEEHFVTSGLAEDEVEEMKRWPGAHRFFEHLRELSGPVRLDDLPDYALSHGYGPEVPASRTLLAMPMRHRGTYVGHFFLGEKTGGPAFGGSDEEVLGLFASQAAAAICNARTHRAKRRALADLEALVDTAPVGVLVLDGETGRAVRANREARRMAGSLSAESPEAEDPLAGVTCRRADGREVQLGGILAEDGHAGELAGLLAADGSGGPGIVRAEEMSLVAPDGRSVEALVNVTPIFAGDGALASVVVTVQDLAPLKELDRLRAEFLGMVSHELRAPLTSIKGSAVTALGAARVVDPAEARQFFRIIEEQADHMNKLIGDLLDVGRIEAGTLSVEPEPSDVAKLVEQARSTFASGGGRHAVSIDLAEGLPRVMADRQRIVQVLNNLLANAARQSPETSPIKVSAVHEGVHVALSVTDAGRGVAPELLPRLFDRHGGLAGSGRTGDRSGGLGLAICKGLVEAHGGRIRAESDGDGMGARFTFTLPVAGDWDRAEPGGIPARSATVGRDPTRILVVDDDPAALRYVRDALETAGYDVVATGEPGEVEELVRERRPALVLLDLLLPGTDGIELMESLPVLADLPVIFISAYGRDETVVRALESGAADYIVKPFSPTELVARVRAAMRVRIDPEPFVLGDLEIRHERQRVTVAGREVRLTAIEYEILHLLSTRAGRPVTYETVLRHVWEGRRAGSVGTVRAFVKKLRAKLGEDAGSPNWILTERGRGYSMPRPDEVKRD